jgi:hypothetical protein
MDPGFRSPLVDFFRRGEVARDVRLMAAQGAFAPRALEQVALLIILSDDPDPQIAICARATIDLLPTAPLRAFLARTDVPPEMRQFFAAQGIVPGPRGDETAEEPLVDIDHPSDSGSGLIGAEESEEAARAAEEGKAGPDLEEGEGDDEAATAVLSSLSVMQRMKLAMKGTREQRARLVRDSNKLVSAAVMSSPKLTETEVEAFTKMGNVSDDVLRIIATNRSWMKNYGIMLGVAKHPKTPPAISMPIVARLNERDQKSLSVDRNVPEGVRLAARKFVVKALK